MKKLVTIFALFTMVMLTSFVEPSDIGGPKGQELRYDIGGPKGQELRFDIGGPKGQELR